MSPERSPKRQKVSTSGEPVRPTEISLQPTTNKANNESALSQSQRSSWYNSWSRKALPVAELADQTARSTRSTSVTVMKPPDSPKTRSVRSPSLAMTLGKKQPNRGLPADATTTMINAEASTPSRNNSAAIDTKPEAVPPVNVGEEHAKMVEQPPVPLESDNQKKPQDDAADMETATPQRNSWLEWMGRGDAKSAEAAKDQPTSIENLQHDSNSDAGQSQQIASRPPKIAANSDNLNQTEKRPARRSWLPWSNEETPASAKTEETTVVAPSKTASEEHKPSSTPINMATKAVSVKSSGKPGPDSVASSSDVAPPPSLPHDGSKASAWAFWSRERKANSSSASIDRPQEGEIAISDTPSQGKPRRASISVPKTDKKLSEQAVGTKVADATVTQKTKEGPTIVQAESANATATAQKVPEQRPSTPVKLSKAYQNILLPDLHATLKIPANPSIVQQLAKLLYITKEPELKHLSLVRDPPKIRNALAIGVHGYFPAPFIRTVIGQPTGTSIKFADMASKAIKRWTKARNYDCEVKTAALEGEGKIAERIDLLWKLLLNWIEEIRKSDFVLIACHSQGVPVAIMLVAKLIQFGCLSDARIGICAMAGVNMGPFPEYKSRFISGSAGELFEFSDPASKVSQDYLAALETVLKFGARITFIGSIDDQLVSLESSIYSSLSHPHIYRAVSIDARLHAPTFLSHLVGFALKLRNLGIQDHGLIRELSSPLAGSLYTGDGHSRIYESENCYDMAVDWSLLTTSMNQAPVLQRPRPASGNNPYILPFAMRGILEEQFVRTELQGETSELLLQFDEWKPTTKVLKDVKFRLEGIRSKL